MRGAQHHYRASTIQPDLLRVRPKQKMRKHTVAGNAPARHYYPAQWLANRTKPNNIEPELDTLCPTLDDLPPQPIDTESIAIVYIDDRWYVVQQPTDCILAEAPANQYHIPINYITAFMSAYYNSQAHSNRPHFNDADDLGNTDNINAPNTHEQPNKTANSAGGQEAAKQASKKRHPAFRNRVRNANQKSTGD